jgi:CRP-like cAMP-binding protein
MGLTGSSAADRLREFPLFADCDTADLKKLTRESAETSVPAGWALIQDETPGDACYVILSGEAKVTKGGDSIATLGTGDIVGEVALLTTGLRTASVIAVTQLSLLHIKSDAFAHLLEQRPDLRDKLKARHKGN